MGISHLKFCRQILKNVNKNVYIKPECKIEYILPREETVSAVITDVFTKAPRKQQIIKPCCLGKASDVPFANRLRGEYNRKIENGELANIYFWGSFKDSVNPICLKEQILPIENSMHLTNFDKLGGSLAISSHLDGTVLSTDGLFQCAGLSIVDKSQSLQTLVHCYADEATSDMKKMLEYILKHSGQNDIEISIVPGCRATTGLTVTAISDLVKQICPNAKINYMNFPKGVSRSKDTAIILRNGKLSFCDTNLIQNKTINPLDDIIYFSD